MEKRREQAEAYLKEAELTLRSARAILKTSKEQGEEMWAQVVKNGYDAVEQAASAGIAARGEMIPRDHPAKIRIFTGIYKMNQSLQNSLFSWLRRRSGSQYVDIVGDEIRVPHRSFGQKDAEKIVEDAEEVIELVRQELKE